MRLSFNFKKDGLRTLAYTVLACLLYGLQTVVPGLEGINEDTKLIISSIGGYILKRILTNDEKMAEAMLEDAWEKKVKDAEKKTLERIEDEPTQ